MRNNIHIVSALNVLILEGYYKNVPINVNGNKK